MCECGLERMGESVCEEESVHEIKKERERKKQKNGGWGGGHSPLSFCHCKRHGAAGGWQLNFC